MTAGNPTGCQRNACLDDGYMSLRQSTEALEALHTFYATTNPNPEVGPRLAQAGVFNAAINLANPALIMRTCMLTLGESHPT